MIVLVIGVSGAAYLLFGRDTDKGPGPVAGQLRGTFPTQPAVGWRLPAAEIFDGAAFVRPDSTSYQYQRPGFIAVDDAVITAAVLPRTDRPATLLAIDAGTGDVRWTADVGFAPVCASASVDGLLPCVSKEATFGPSAAPRQVSFVRMSDGTVDHVIPVSEYVRAVEVADSTVYTMAFDHERMVRTITRGTVDNLTAVWSRDYPLSDDDAGCVGSGDTTFDGVDSGVVFSGNDGGMVIANAADGKLLVPEQVTHLSVHEGQGLIARSCAGSEFDAVNTVVVGADGSLLRTVEDHELAADPWLVEPNANVPYIIGRTAYDFATGRELWTTSIDRNTTLQAIIGDTVIGGLGFEETGISGFDLATGQHLWTNEMDASRIELSDGKRIMLPTDGGLVALDMATGDEVWTIREIDLNEYLAPVGVGFASTTGDYITYYPPTGGASVAPGRSSGEESSLDTDASGGVITKCGRPPEMRPVKYRAENGSLIVTMELRARCPSGDIISTNRMLIRIRDQLGPICSATFDFSGNPLVLGGEGSAPTTLELEFGDGTYTRHPNTLGEHSGGSGPVGSTDIVTEADASGNEVVECEDDGTSSGPQSADTPTDRARVKGLAKAPDDNQSGCGSDADALAALRAQVEADRPFVRSRLENRWVPQLSAKRPGLVAPEVDGRMVTWTPCEILRQHLRMRGQYPEVRLVWSDEWRTFDLAGWWVTLGGVIFENADAANGWCDQRRIPVDECFAKVVSSTGDSRGTTKYRR